MATVALILCIFLSGSYIVQGQNITQFTQLVDKCKENSRSCVSLPLACLVNEDAGACEAVAHFEVKNDTISTFALAVNRTEGYIALGFSDDADMGWEVAVDCINGTIAPAYNTNTTNFLSDPESINGLIDITNSTEDSLFCEFDIDTKIEVETYSVDYNGSYYLVLAYGDLDADSKPTQTTKVVISEHAFTLNVNSGVAISLSGLLMVLALIVNFV